MNKRIRIIIGVIALVLIIGAVILAIVLGGSSGDTVEGAEDTSDVTGFPVEDGDPGGQTDGDVNGADVVSGTDIDTTVYPASDTDTVINSGPSIVTDTDVG